MEASISGRSDWMKHYLHASSIPFWGLHAFAIYGVWKVGFSWSGLALAMGLYFARMFFVTGVYHRYFSHRSYKTSRFFQFVLALLGGMSIQKGALWWAGNHRHHHKFSDMPEDLHSVRQQGLMWSHMGWIISRDYNETRVELMRDFTKYPELLWLNKYHHLVAIAYGVILYLALGFSGLVWGLGVSTVLLWHGTFTINSLSHMFGSRRYATSDDSRNNWLLALITMGEGWHNNHHYYQSTANQGFYWWEIDVSYYILLGLSRVGLVWDLRKPPQWVLDEGRGKKAAAPSESDVQVASIASDAAI